MSELNFAKQYSVGHFTHHACALNTFALLLPQSARVRLLGSMGVSERYCR